MGRGDRGNSGNPSKMNSSLWSSPHPHCKHRLLSPTHDEPLVLYALLRDLYWADEAWQERSVYGVHDLLDRTHHEWLYYDVAAKPYIRMYIVRWSHTVGRKPVCSITNVFITIPNRSEAYKMRCLLRWHNFSDVYSFRSIYGISLPSNGKWWHLSWRW